MRTPRDLSGRQLAKALDRLWYRQVRQTGSHIRLTTALNGDHHLTIPDHKPIKVGTLDAILKDALPRHASADEAFATASRQNVKDGRAKVVMSGNKVFDAEVRSWTTNKLGRDVGRPLHLRGGSGLSLQSTQWSGVLGVVDGARVVRAPEKVLGGLLEAAGGIAVLAARR